MTAMLITSFDTVEQALDWVERHGEVVRGTLMRGNDGKVRGNALVRERAA